MMSDDNVKETKDKNAAHKNQVAKGKRTEREEWQNYTKERKSMEKVVKQAKGRALQRQIGDDLTPKNLYHLYQKSHIMI